LYLNTHLTAIVKYQMKLKIDGYFKLIVVATVNFFFPLKLFYYTPRSVTQDTICCHRQSVILYTVGCATDLSYSWHFEYFHD